MLLRVQIIYNRAYGQFVLLFHADTSSFDYSAVGAAMSASITGPYTYVRAFHPDGLASFDMGVFQVCSLDFNWYLFPSKDLTSILKPAPVDLLLVAVNQ